MRIFGPYWPFWLLMAGATATAGALSEQAGSAQPAAAALSQSGKPRQSGYPALPLPASGSEADQRDPADVLKLGDDPAGRQWYRQQNQLAIGGLAAMPAAGLSEARLSGLMQQSSQNQINCYLSNDAVTIFSQTGADGRTAVYLSMAATNAERQLYLSEARQRCSQLWWSADSNQVVIAMQPDSSEPAGKRQLQLVDGDKASLLASIDTGQTDYPQQVFWLRDGDFLYSRAGQSGAREIWRHRHSQPVADDQPVLAAGQPKWLASGDDVSLIIDPDSELMLLRQLPRNAARPTFYHSRKDSKTGLPGNWEKLAGPDDGVLEAALGKQQLVLLMQGRNGQREIRMLSQKQLQIKKAGPVLPAGQEFWLELKSAAGQVYLHAAVGGQSRLYRLNADGTTSPIRLPLDGSLDQWSLSAAGELQSLTMETLLRAPQTYRSSGNGQFEPVIGYGVRAPAEFPLQAEPHRVMLKPAGQVDLLTISASAGRPDMHLLALQALPPQRPLWRFQPEWQAWLEAGGQLSLLNINELSAVQPNPGAPLAGRKAPPPAAADPLDALLQVLRTIRQRDPAGLPLLLQERQPGSRLGLLAGLREPALLCALSSSDPLSQSVDQQVAQAASANNAGRAGKLPKTASPLAYAYDQVYAGMAYPALLLFAHADSAVPLWSAAKMVAAVQILGKPGRPAWLISQPAAAATEAAATGAARAARTLRDAQELAQAWRFFRSQCSAAGRPAESGPAASASQAISKPRS